ncbi:DUF4870 domain-containing protein [Salinadaptatus halalkaliphilus]|uniref:DUF4870 domain-containing protein n=1 Tax=Salinadaptatus halalkaliphilus TaxID=2419781 RepID=A0A4S3TRR5_9EURY|nr:DUF4870 domain-containing protein [Salinadaptatus halalkaliphilus]THE66053.1 DUF4870 domain-containing protein [Salinadaptatus halalkaliphilus]
MSTHADGDTTMAALAHISALVASFLGPLLILVLADDTDTLVKENAKNALNFQILVFIAMVISGALTVVLIGLLLIPIVGLVNVILVILATIKANNSEIYSYPFTPSII